MKKSGMDAIKLRNTLITIFVIVILAALALFGINISNIKTVATQATNGSTTNLTASKFNNDSDITAMDVILKENADIIQKTSDLIAISDRQNYESTVTTLVQSLATSAGVTVSNIAFDSSNNLTSQNPENRTSIATRSTHINSSQTTTSTLKSANVEITSPVEYTKLLNFIYLLEHSVSAITVSSLVLDSSGVQNSASSVNVTKLQIGIRL